MTEYHNEDFDVEAQQAARDAVMEIPLFPDLDVLLIDKLTYGPHCKMLQHFAYWFHPRHPKMQERWTMYKTYEEWRSETGLKRKQVDKGREKLRELGLVTEKKGPHGRLHYRIDWVALAEVLSLSPVGEQTDDLDDLDDFDFDEISLSPVGEQGQFVPLGEQSSLSPYGEHANTGDYAGDYLTGKTLLQRADEPAFAEPSAYEYLSNEEKSKVWTLILSGDTDVSRFAENCIKRRSDANGEAFTTERLIRKIKELTGGTKPIEAYEPFVKGCLEELARETA
jgi:hypothetical protein